MEFFIQLVYIGFLYGMYKKNVFFFFLVKSITNNYILYLLWGYIRLQLDGSL